MRLRVLKPDRLVSLVTDRQEFSLTASLNRITCTLTLLVEFPDDRVQVSVLERNMTASHRHFGAERKGFSDT